MPGEAVNAVRRLSLLPCFVVLASAFEGDALPPAAWEQVAARLAKLRAGQPDRAFAVRSSGLSEDSAQASFAGEFETALDVRDDAAIRSAIETVRRSRHAGRVAAYSSAQGLASKHEVAVVVQLLRAGLREPELPRDPGEGVRAQPQTVRQDDRGGLRTDPGRRGDPHVAALALARDADDGGGSPLSGDAITGFAGAHAAIVARELGIPAVVGCGNATMRLRTGDHVRVNGGQGTVEVLRAAEAAAPAARTAP